MSEMLKTLLYLSLCGTALGCVVAIMQRLVGRRLPSRFYYFAYLVVLARFALPIPGLVATERAAESERVTASQPSHLAALPSARDSRSDVVMPMEPSDAADEPMAADAVAVSVIEPVAEAEPETASTQTAAIAHASFTVPAWGWTALWLGGALAMALWYVGGYRRFTRCLRKTLLLPTAADEQAYRAIPVKRRPALMRSAAVTTPMLFGVAHPTIVLPDEDHEPETLRMILLHELTHHRRGDVAVKWLAAAVHCIHWFNPFLPLIRRRLDRCCELSCDERLLRGMDKGQRQAYGHALLAMASSAPLGAAVVATTFATEKRTLKERLEQIMKHKTRKSLVLILALAAAMLLCACAVAIGPEGEKEDVNIAVEVSAAETENEELPLQPSGEPYVTSGEASGESGQVTVEVTKPAGGQSVTVSTVDELLAAIAPGNEVHLQPGIYELDKASDYGQARIGGYYTWEPVFDGYELVISDVVGFTLGCEGDDNAAELRTLPRYADVLAFYGCDSIRMEQLTIGHTEGAGSCSGSVVKLNNADDVDIWKCRLYGCGTIGVEAENSLNITVENSDIYECSMMAAQFSNCWNVRMAGCELYDCGDPDGWLYSLVNVKHTYGVVMADCEIYNNSASAIFSAAYAGELYMTGCQVYDNELADYVFALSAADVTVADCSFDGDIPAWVGKAQNYYADHASAGRVYDREGNELTDAALEAMEYAHALDYADAEGYDPVYGTMKAPQSVAVDIETGEDGRYYATVSTVDEFLAAIAPNTTIRMAAGTYDLSEAEYYGIPLSGYYGWESGYDGPQLVISGVDGLTIEGAGAESTTLLAVPRVAEIISFYRCEDLSVSGLTAGHVELSEGCGAGVLGFDDCQRVEVVGCGLFGCGIRGVRAEACTDLAVRNTEIYDCSLDAARITSCENVVFENCDIHDCNSNEIVVFESTNVTQDGKDLTA